MEEIGKQRKNPPATGIFNMAPFQQIKTWILAYIHPVQTFEAQKSSISAKKICIDLALIYIISFLFFLILTLVFRGTTTQLLGYFLPNTLPFFIFFSAIAAFFFVVARLVGGKAGLLEHVYAFDLLYGGLGIILAIGYTGIIVTSSLFFNVLNTSKATEYFLGFSLLTILFLVYDFIVLLRHIHKLSIIRTALLVLLTPILAVFLIIINMIVHGPGPLMGMGGMR